MKVRLTILFLFILSKSLIAQPHIISDKNNNVFISAGIEYYIDSNNSLRLDQLKDSVLFNSRVGHTPVFTSDVKNVWLKFSVINNSSFNAYLDISYTNISKVSLYRLEGNNIRFVDEAGNNVLTKKFNPGSPDIIFNLNIPQFAQEEFFLHVESIHPIILPMYIGTTPALIKNSSVKNLFIGFYFGLLVVIFFYNLFLFISTKDINYLLYIIYIFTLTFAQLAASGYGYFYFWPKRPEWNTNAVLWGSYFSGITAFIFSLSFLHVHYYLRKLFPYLLIIFGIYLFGITASLFGNFGLSYIVLNYTTLFNGAVALALSIYISKKGYRPAIFYLIAWTALLISVFILVLRNINILPYNDFTSSAFYIGSSLEVALLSIALADRINILKREKELSQAETLQRAKENERLVKEQNIILENKVEQRTHELQQTNINLSNALDNLKDAQTQLVEAEKMASLGQLTAGIAHEINNPINFVKSNINPLRLDVKDLVEILSAYDELHTLNGMDGYEQKLKAIKNMKDDIDIDFLQKEIDSLILGIEEGAERTAEIVKGLRTFSRIDEAALKKVNVHDGILSTLVLLKNTLPYYIHVVKHFNSNGEIECYPGKLNQVFMNILTNAVQSIKSKPLKTDDEIISIATRDADNDQIEISIKDSGIGMADEVKRHIFEPFFTTKDIGEGTGLGMAIVFKIIQKHEGKINIISEPAEGAEFIITLPRHQDSD